MLKLSAAKVSKETLVLYLKRNKRVFSLYIICLHLKVLRRGHMDKEGKFTKARVEIENRFAIYRLTSGFNVKVNAESALDEYMNSYMKKKLLLLCVQAMLTYNYIALGFFL